MEGLLLDKFSETDAKTANSLIIRVPKDGSYYLAFQGYCPTHTSNDFVLSDISMVEDALHSAPDTVTALTVTPGAEGALNGKPLLRGSSEECRRHSTVVAEQGRRVR